MRKYRNTMIYAGLVFREMSAVKRLTRYLRRIESVISAGYSGLVSVIDAQIFR